ncbi:MAG: acetoacetate decarboxylase family protein [Deltaproteobacteria bacterium]|nr:acetoacetate decarboxylase family protein [Deltaproteobacteria bacterium]MBW2395950.1 acetoacetate decarboxylase family protein [Deltaproteobacteria bacterium]
MTESAGPKIAPGDILGWPILKIDYPTDADRIAALLPPGIEPSASANVHLSIYNFPVPDEPEYGVVVSVDADYRGTPGLFALGYGIDQESAIFISRDMNGQPKYPCAITYYRLGASITARCTHQGYTFIEFKGQTTGVAESPEPFAEHEWWVKVSRAVGGAEKAYDFPPHVVKVATTYQTFHQETVEGELVLRESPWDPIAELLPQRGDLSARLWTAMPTSREITLEGALDPDGFWPHSDTIGGSRWPGSSGGPKR